jgi:hypothetical protein
MTEKKDHTKCQDALRIGSAHISLVSITQDCCRSLSLEKENGNSLWYDTIQKVLKNVQVAFNILSEDKATPIGCKQIPCYLIFDIKMDVSHKAHFVAGGHKTDPPSSLTYSSIVSRDSVHIAFMIAASNDLDIQSAVVGNAYINAVVREKEYFIAGDEFGEEKKGERGYNCQGFVWT